LSSAAKDPNRPQRTKAQLALLVVAALIMIPISDVTMFTLRKWGAARATKAGWQEEFYRIRDSRYRYDLMPNATKDSAPWGPIFYPVRTNSLGFRDSRVREVPLRDSLYRMVLIGSSYAEGLGVAFDSTFAGLLAIHFRPQGVEVLNAAVTNYSPVIYWKKIEDLIVRRGMKVDAVVVLIDASDIMHESLDYRLDGSGNVVDAPPRPQSWWVHNSYIYRYAQKGLFKLNPTAPIGCVGNDTDPGFCRTLWTTAPAIMRDWGGEGLAKADAHMTQLAALLRARHIPLTVVVYPRPEQLTRNDRSSLQVSHWQSWSRNEGAQFIQLFDAFFARVDSLGVSRAISENFIPGDVHLNAHGHQFVASELERQLVAPSASQASR